MITILHGDNIAESRKELDRIKSEFEGEILAFDAATLTETDFVQATQSKSIFKKTRLVIIEGMPKFDLGDADAVLWVNKKVTPPKGAKAKEFPVPQLIWKFLDNPTVPMFRQTIKNNDVQFVFLMLVRKYRLASNKAALQKLLEIDYRFKTGRLAGDLPLAIELFLLGI